MTISRRMINAHERSLNFGISFKLPNTSSMLIGLKSRMPLLIWAASKILARILRDR